jgi:hypothetical protein
MAGGASDSSCGLGTPLRDHDVPPLADDQVRTDFVLSTDVLA